MRKQFKYVKKYACIGIRKKCRNGMHGAFLKREEHFKNEFLIFSLLVLNKYLTEIIYNILY